jgi:hypothetical protein
MKLILNQQLNDNDILNKPVYIFKLYLKKYDNYDLLSYILQY